MNKFKVNKKARCALCDKAGSEQPRYGVTPAETVCEPCWENRQAEAEARLNGEPPAKDAKRALSPGKGKGKNEL